MTTPVRARRVDYACPWFDVLVKDVELPAPRGVESFWSVRTANDYVAALAVTGDGRIPLVRQFRPAVEAYVLELPSGAVEDGEAPEAAMRRELLEETGCEAGELHLLGCLHTDSGRMETRQWAYFAPAARVVAPAPVGDEPLELIFVDATELRRLVAAGEFRMSVHLGVLAAALLQGRISL